MRRLGLVLPLLVGITGYQSADEKRQLDRTRQAERVARPPRNWWDDSEPGRNERYGAPEHKPHRPRR